MIYTYIRVASHVYTYRPTRTLAWAYAYIRISLCERTYKFSPQYTWLSCHNLPAGLYRWLCRRTLRHDGYFVTYFHPWEFYPLGEHPELKMPFIIRNHSGKGMEKRLNDLICYFKSTGEKFVTYSEFAREKRQNL